MRTPSNTIHGGISGSPILGEDGRSAFVERREQAKRLTFSEWGGYYFSEIISPDKRSFQWQRTMFAKLESKLGDMYLDEIDEDVIDSYRERRLRP